MSKEYNSKSAIILQRYTPKKIQEFLNSGESKSSIVKKLGLYLEVFNKYIKQHNLIYNPSKKHDKRQVKRYKEISVKDVNLEKAEDPVKKFYEMLARKKEKRVLRELKNPYDW
jgi:hypothetical protein